MSQNHERISAFANGPYAPGMYLRDWFAGLAMSGALANTQPKEMPKGGYAEWIEGVARESYAYADAMMEARK